ncbi:uncharacterized protein LOC135471834 [Liolophura sinensis]|uniref:uncharacterized protein LOC135471834 n=1 Tax=Liolophura sinensis TaxID=3198878 RepID=UPI0031586540
MKVDRVIKLGGSAITRKDQLETLKLGELESGAKLVKRCVDNHLNCVIVHGAGCFGHFHAKEYSVVSGCQKLTGDSQARAAKGFVLTRQSVTKLNKLVVDCLISNSVPAVSVSPCSSWKTRDGKVLRDGVDVVADLLEKGFVPVLHGDCCLDTIRGWTILSGDTIIQTICEKLTVDTVVFLTDVEGVYDRPPSDANANLLPEILVQEGGTTVDVITRTTGCDVTGGIKQKIDSAVGVVTQTKGSTSVFVCGINAPVAQRVCLSGVSESRGDGTLIRLAETGT